MPSSSDDQSSWTAGNPFEEPRQRIPIYSAQEIATLQSRLEKQLGPEYISSRPGPGGKKIHYLASEKCINLANEVFGFNGWSSSIREVQVDFVDESATTGKISMGLSVIVRVTLKDGAYHEDMGYGHIENCKDKAAAFEKAKKEAVSDARKRALRNFGNVLGNCIYDKDYLAKVTKIKAEPSKFNTEQLHRQSDHVTIKKEPVTDPRVVMQSAKDSREAFVDVEDEFGAADFDDADFSVSHEDHPDEISLDNKPINSANPAKPSPASTGLTIPAQRRQLAVNQHNPQAAVMRPPGNISGAGNNAWTPNGQVPQMNRAAQSPGPNAQRPPPGQVTPGRGQFIPAQQQQQQQGTRPLPGLNSSNQAIEPPQPNFDGQVGFFTARAAETLQSGGKALPENAQFNPRLESPSIRKTAGFDHSSSRPTPRDAANSVPSSSQQALPPSRANFVNPHLDPSRKIGMPASMASPLQNRTTFKQPQMKRPADAATYSRPALNDVTNNLVNTSVDLGDTKRQKVGLAPQTGSNDGTIARP